MSTKTLAIISPRADAYSETFIRAHKSLPFNIRFYYGGEVPKNLEGYGKLLQHTTMAKIQRKFAKSFKADELAFRRSLLKEKVDVVLVEFGTTAVAVLNVIQSLNLPMVVHFHGYDASVKPILANLGPLYREVFAYAKGVIAVSLKMRQSLVDLGCPESKLFLNHYGPQPVFFGIQPEYLQPQFVSVGRFVDKKAPYLTLAAFKEVVNRFPDARLVIAGNGPLLNTCMNLTRVWGIEKNVSFTDAITPAEIHQLFATSLGYVQHSIVAADGDSEGTPLAVLEAQAAGLPVISTFHAGIPDVVLHGETGFLVEELDVTAMAQAMIQLVSNRDLAKKMGLAGKERIKNHFTLEKHLAVIEGIINK